MWKLSIEDDQGQSTIVQLVRSEYSIGRTQENSIRLTERNVSRRHATLIKQGAAWFLDDLGSYNGCFVNGLRVVDHHPVNVGDLLQLGDYRLELFTEEGVAVAAQQPTLPRRADTLSTTLNLAAQTDRLVMVVGPTPGREYMLAHAPHRVGRGEECDICVNHSSVSRWHADLHYIGSSRYEIIDHGSSNGIRINGVDLDRGLLDARDLVELGDIVLKFIPAGQVYRPSPEESKQLAALLGVDLEGPEPTRSDRLRAAWRSLSRATRVGLIMLGLAVVVLMGLSQLSERTRLRIRPDLLGSEPSPHQVALAEAVRLLAQGKTISAHEKALTIPASSNLRQDPSFKLIEARWADSQLRKAEAGGSVEERRLLLDAVAAATTVDEATRRRAADALAALREESTVPSALPSGSASPETDALIDAGVETDASSSASSEIPEDVPSQASVPEPPPPVQKTVRRASTARAVGTTPLRNTTSSTTSKSTGNTGTSEPNTTDLATSGNLESLKNARDTLRRKVSAGTASDKDMRLLRALCRQLGDTSCQR